MLPAFIIAWLIWPAFVLSLEIELSPKQRNVTRGEAVEFHYKPKDQIATNVSVVDTLTNKTFSIVDNAVNGTVKWVVPDDMEVRGGYFYQAVRRVNNASIIATSTSEFQVLGKPKPKPKPSQKPEPNNADAMARSVWTAGSVLLMGLAFLGA